MPISRRQFLHAALVTGSTALLNRSLLADENVPVRAITRGPKYHWFGYYDKLQFDPTNRYVLSNEVEFEGRTPTPSDVINVGMIDLHDGDRWIELGQSNAWGWQQGCMLQWRPGSDSEVVWNDREGDQFVCRILDINTREQRTIPTPIYTLSPDGKFAMTADFSRIQVMRPGYGYVGLQDIHGDEKAPEDSGIFRVDLETGEKQLVLSLAEIAKIPFNGESLEDHWHWFNHLLISPDSKRFIALHRWKPSDPETGGPKSGGGWKTRMITANVDGSDLYLLNPSGIVSHFVWKDPEHVCMWTRPEGQPSGFYLLTDKSREIQPVGAGVMTKDGHNTYVPGHPGWILCDTYPNKERNQVPYLFYEPTNQRFDLGEFYSPPEYKGEWRCDTHPRNSNDGTLVTIDSTHGGNGRQVYLLDISKILKKSS